MKDTARGQNQERRAMNRETFTVIDTKTGKEPDTWTIARTEEWAKDLIYCNVDSFAIMEDGTLILVDTCGNFAFCPSERFEVKWDESLGK